MELHHSLTHLGRLSLLTDSDDHRPTMDQTTLDLNPDPRSPFHSLPLSSVPTVPPVPPKYGMGTPHIPVWAPVDHPTTVLSLFASHLVLLLLAWLPVGYGVWWGHWRRNKRQSNREGRRCKDVRTTLFLVVDDDN
jgi:hypothetical protein